LVVLTNLSGTQLPEALLWYLNDRYFDNPHTDWSALLRGGLQEQQTTARADPPTMPASALPLSSYMGTFRHRVYGELTLEAASDTLALTVGPHRVRITLRHWNRDTFLVSWPETGAYPGASGFATFANDPKGQPVSLTLDLFADVDKGPFMPVEPSHTP
jgi:hypothetical protein